MSAFVIDTNVLATANLRAPQAGSLCVKKTIEALSDIRLHHCTVIDSSMVIFKEYFRHASLRGQPGAGDAFVKWLWDNQGNGRYCERVLITPLGSDDYEEFPRDAGLENFDRNDRKFVAVAVASAQSPEILNAVDTDWHHFRAALEKHGVRVRFLCPELMQ